MDRTDTDGINSLAKKLMVCHGDRLLNPPFYCDYGYNIEVGNNCLFSYNCTIIDVEIGDNVWLGGNVTVCPGVKIGSNTIIPKIPLIMYGFVWRK